MRYIIFLLSFFLINNESLRAKILMLMGYIINANRQKILLKEQEESKIEYVFSVKKIKMKLIWGLEIRTLI